MSAVAMNYDRKYDILYARYPNAGHSYGEENDDGVVVYHNIENDSITGVAVYSISEKLKSGKFDISMLPVPLNINTVSSLITNHS